jgi:hypothetical protein
VDRHRANTSSYGTYVSRYDLFCILKIYIIWIYLRADTVDLAGRIIGLKSNSEMENICEEKLQGPYSDIQHKNFLDALRYSLNEQFPN